MTSPQPARDLGHLILTLRGQRVLLDSDLAALYGVSTGNLNKAVRHNLDRFPEDFMFQLHSEEAEALRFQSGTSYRRYLPYSGSTVLMSATRVPSFALVLAKPAIPFRRCRKAQSNRYR